MADDTRLTVLPPFELLQPGDPAGPPSSAVGEVIRGVFDVWRESKRRETARQAVDAWEHTQREHELTLRESRRMDNQERNAEVQTEDRENDRYDRRVLEVLRAASSDPDRNLRRDVFMAIIEKRK